MTAGQPEAGSGASRPRPRRLRRWGLIGALALAAVIAGSVALAMAGDQQRGNLLPPSIATDARGLSTVAWAEIGREGVRVAQESAPGIWSLPQLVDADGGPGSVAVGRDRLAHLAYTGPGGLYVADQLPGSQGRPAFRSHLVARDAVGRPSIADSPSGTTAVIYETGDSQLRVARRNASGRWQIGPTGIAGSQPLLDRSGAGRFAAAALAGHRVQFARAGASAPFRSAGEVRSPGPLLGFDLTTARGRPLVSYVEEELQLVIVARPGLRNGLQIAGATTGIGSFSAVAAAGRGRTVVMFRHPSYGFVSLVVVKGRSRSATLALSTGQSGDLAVDPAGREAHVAYWDPAGLGLLGARVPLRGVPLSPSQPITTFFHSVVPAGVTPISIPQTSLPTRDKASIWLASLALLMAIAAGSLLLLERRHGMRLLPFGIVLAVLAGFGLRGAYLAQLGIYGLPPNDLLPLDRAGVEAVVDALVILAGSAATVCAVGFLLPVGWGRRALGKLAGISLPSRRGALLALAAFLLISLAMAAYVVRDEGLKELFESRQTAFAGSGYQLALLSAGAGAWLVYFAVIGWPSESRERTLLVISGLVTLVPLLFSGARSVVLLGFVVPIALLVHLRIRPISLRAAVIGALVLLALAIATRDLARGGSGSAVLEEATQANGPVVRALKPALGWTEAAGLDALVLVRTEYVPRYGTDPAVTPGPFAGIAIPRSIWPGKPRSAMDTFSERLNPWNYDVSKVGKTTTLAGEFEMDAGLAGVFVGFVLFALLLTALGELLAGVGGIFGILVAIALIPRVGAAFWGDSFNAGWGGIVLIVMMALAVAVGRAIGESGARRSARAPGPG